MRVGELGSLMVGVEIEGGELLVLDSDARGESFQLVLDVLVCSVRGKIVHNHTDVLVEVGIGF